MGQRGRSSLWTEEVFFATTTVVNHAEVFAEGPCCDLLIKNIKHYQQRYLFSVLGYVIMPSHLHWIVRVDNECGTISDIMRDIKKYTAWDVLELLEEQGKRNLIGLFAARARPYPRHKRKFWNARFDDEVIRNSEMFFTKLAYIHDNPVRAGLVEKPEDYPYSSARNYILGDHSEIYVDTEYAV
jgi:putative transposase